MDPWPLSGPDQWTSWSKALYNSQPLDLWRMADLLYEWNMVGSPSCSVLRLHNAQRAAVNLVRSYPSQLKRYQALTWWMEDKSWEGYPFRQSWMTLTEPCVKAHFVFACTVVSFTCQWYWWLPLYEAFSLYSLQQVTQLAKWKKHQGDKMLLWSKNSSSKIYFVFVLCYNKN